VLIGLIQAWPHVLPAGRQIGLSSGEKRGTFLTAVFLKFIELNGKIPWGKARRR
jgi:hypothetical protein